MQLAALGRAPLAPAAQPQSGRSVAGLGRLSALPQRSSTAPGSIRSVQRSGRRGMSVAAAAARGSAGAALKQAVRAGKPLFGLFINRSARPRGACIAALASVQQTGLRPTAC